MSESEMNNYRFSSGEEPSDEMLCQLMKEVAQDVNESNEKVMFNFFDSLRKEAKEIRNTLSKQQVI